MGVVYIFARIALEAAFDRADKAYTIALLEVLDV